MAGVILKGGKIGLGLLRQEDIPFVIKRYSDPRVLRWIADSDTIDAKTKRSVIKKTKYLAEKKPKDDKMFIVKIKNGRRWESIGDCELLYINERDHSAVFSICIDPNHWLKGYGTEATKILFNYAFGKMHLHRIESHVAEYNIQSIGFHEKFGFIEEGRLKEALFRNGRFCDRIIFRLLESEWKKEKRN